MVVTAAVVGDGVFAVSESADGGDVVVVAVVVVVRVGTGCADRDKGEVD